MASALHLSSYSMVCWRPGKHGYLDLAHPIPLSDAAQPPPPLTPVLRDAGIGTLALAGIQHPKRKLSLWTSWRGPKPLKTPPKGVGELLHLCTDGPYYGVFFSRHDGADLAFALLEHGQSDVYRTVGRPKVFAAELAALLDEAVPQGERERRRQHRKQSAKTAFFAIRHAALRRTARGYVVAAVVAAQSGVLYGLVGDLEGNAWRKWRLRLPAAASSPPCVYVSPSGDDVRFLHCDIATPADVDGSGAAVVTAPSAALALSFFERLPSADSDAAAVTRSGTAAACAVLREWVVPTRPEAAVAERRFQSHAFQSSADSAHGGGASCMVAVEDKCAALFTIVVTTARESCVVHATYAEGGGELLASAAAVPGLRDPLSVCSLRLPAHPQRPGGTSFSMVLCRDRRLFACEHFGQAAATTLRVNHLPATSVTFPLPAQVKPTKKLLAAMRAADGAPELTRLLAVRGGTELVCSNGVLGVFFRVAGAVLPGPPPALSTSAPREAAGGDGAAALRRCLAKLEAAALRTTRHDLPDVVFRDILPCLRYVGTAQEEVALMQRVYEQLLRMAGPNLQSEWSYLWALTSVLQRTLARRGAGHRALYTDLFFLRLAEAYRGSGFATAEGAAAVAEAVRADVSAEAARVVAAEAPQLASEVQYVLDGLADSVPPHELAAEVARRMVHTSTLSNGTCVVSTHGSRAECVHCLGCVLLASCLDVAVGVYAAASHSLRVCVGRGEEEASPQELCVAVTPFAFQTQEEFEAALTLASDLLCVSTADSSFRPDVALLSLAVGSRQHCLAAFVQLYAPVLRSAAEGVSPLANNTAWLETAAAALDRSVGEHFAALLCGSRSTATTLSTTIVYVLYAPLQRLNVALFSALSAVMPEELCTSALVACVLHATGHLVAAAHNYSAAVADATLAKTAADAERAAQGPRLGRHRLRSTLEQAAALWSRVGALSPYAVESVAASYRVSAANSVADGVVPGTQGTVVSRSLVSCFRLLCLVHHCCVCDDAMRPAGEGLPDMQKCVEALQLLLLATEAPLPSEWLQRGFVDRVRSVSEQQPSWAPLLLRLLQLSGVRQTGSAALKKAYYGALDALQGPSAQAAFAAAPAEVQEAVRRATVAAESCATAIALRGDGASSPSATFIFSAKRDASLPVWTHSHRLPQRQFLFSHEWLDELWTLERVPACLQAACDRTLRLIGRSSGADGGAAETDAEASAAAALSMELASPLFAHLCRLRPPVRMHAVPTAPVDGPAVQRQPTAASAASPSARSTPTPPAAAREAATPEKQAAPLLTPPPPPEPRRAAGAATPVAAASAASPQDSPAATPAPDPNSGTAPATAVGATVAAVGVHSPRAAEAAGLYAPADVAWWDAIGTPAPPSAPHISRQALKEGGAVLTATVDDNGESSDTATSYTTSTSNYADPLEALTELDGETERRRMARGRRDADSSSLCSSGVADRRDGRHAAREAGRAPCCSGRRPSETRSHSKTKKRCRCCHRAINRHGRGPISLPDPDVSVRWADGACRLSAPPPRPPTAWADTAAASRPTLLSFASRLQPPEEPATFAAHSARAPSGAGGADRPALLHFTSAATAREPSRVRLYALRGERACAADGDEEVAVASQVPAGGAAALAGRAAAALSAPPVPPSSVFVAPPALLHLPAASDLHGRSAGAAAGAATSAAADAHAVSPELPYPQALRAAVGPAPAAVDVATLHGPSCAPQPAEVPPLPTAPGPAPSLSLPVPQLPTPSSANAGVLADAQMPEFRRYTDELLARQSAALLVGAAGATAPPPTAVAAAPPTAAVRDGASECPGVARLAAQQEDFMRQAQALMETRQAENEGFYRRVVESIRSLTAAAQPLRGGLNPVEQSQLVRDTVRQRNELLGLNHQLLEMQLAAARVGGDATQTAGAAPVPLPTVGSVDTAPASAPPPRSSVGVSWTAPAAPAAVASATTQTPVQPRVGFESTLSDLRRLNAELMGVSASADAMDKAIKETRGVIARYEQSKTAEALTAEGAALTAAMRMRTAAIEQRLSDLPRQPAAMAEPPPQQRWTGQSAGKMEAQEVMPAATAPLQGQAMAAGGAVVAPPPPGDSAAASPAEPQGPAPAACPPSLPAAVPVAVVGGLSTPPLPSPAFTSVSSFPLEVAPAAAEKRHHEWQAPSVSFTHCGRESAAQSLGGGAPHPQHHGHHHPPVASPWADGRSSLPTEETVSGAEAEGSGRAPTCESGTPAQVCATPHDMRALFTQAGGVVHRTAAHTPVSPSARGRPVAAAAARRPPSLVPRPAHTPVRTAHAAPAPSQDRYGMYRASSRPTPRAAAAAKAASACPPLSDSQHSVPVRGAGADAPVQSRAGGDAHQERQRERRMSSLAQRMRQLEHDLFN